MNILIVRSVVISALLFALGSIPAYSQSCHDSKDSYFCKAGYRCCPPGFTYYCKDYRGKDDEELARTRRVAPDAFCVNPDSEKFQDMKAHCRVFGHC